MFKNIVWANDGSTVTERQLPVIKQLAEANTGARVIVAHVQEQPPRGRRTTQTHRPPEAAVRQMVSDLTADGVDAELALIDGPAGHAVEILGDVATRAGADLIVAGGNPQGPIAGFFQGGFTLRLLKATACPVLVIPRSDPGDPAGALCNRRAQQSDADR